MNKTYNQEEMIQYYKSIISNHSVNALDCFLKIGCVDIFGEVRTLDKALDGAITHLERLKKTLELDTHELHKQVLLEIKEYEKNLDLEHPRHCIFQRGLK